MKKSTIQDSPARSEATELIRSVLIKALAGAATPAAHLLRLRIQYATGAEPLWYLRPEVMGVLASLHGEAHARHDAQHHRSG